MFRGATRKRFLLELQALYLSLYLEEKKKQLPPWFDYFSAFEPFNPNPFESIAHTTDAQELAAFFVF